MSGTLDPVKKHQRKSIAERRVGPGAKCDCGEVRPEALISGKRPITCAACDRKRRGKSNMDKHHVAGKANSLLTISIPVNDHRAFFNVAQYEWPQETLRNPTGNIYRRWAGGIRGLADVLRFLIERLLIPLAEGFERCAGSNIGGNHDQEN
jgi:hypothetical protein